LQFHRDDALNLQIRSVDGRILFRGRKQLRSGLEVYGIDIPETLTPGLKISVLASISRTNQHVDLNANQPRYWVVSPNVMDNSSTVGEWRNASVKFRAAFMGWGPDEKEHKGIGIKFAQTIKPGDIILIARRSSHFPEVVGFGKVHGSFKTSLRGFVAPQGDEWHGSLRLLRPFVHRSELPNNLKVVEALGHTTALRELVPSRSHAEQRLCEWLEQGLDRSERALGSGDPASMKHLRTELTHLPHDQELDYQVSTRTQAKRAEKKEAKLVQQYDYWLRCQHRTLHIAKYGLMRCDAYEAGRRNLIEAKCSIRREYIRMAVGQLLDYSYLFAKDVGVPALAILLPSRPSRDIEVWLKAHLEIFVIWKSGRAFQDNANGRFI
jgi:hypothetical protein